MFLNFNYFLFFYLENILKLFIAIFFFSIIVIIIPTLSNFLISKILILLFLSLVIIQLLKKWNQQQTKEIFQILKELINHIQNHIKIN